MLRGASDSDGGVRSAAVDCAEEIAKIIMANEWERLVKKIIDNEYNF